MPVAKNSATFPWRNRSLFNIELMRLLMLYRSIAAALLLMAASATLSACNTVAGAGKDVSSAGKAVTNTADDTKKNN